MPARAKVFEFALNVDRERRIALEGGDPLEIDPSWTPEHLVLAGLARCSVSSLRHFAKAAGATAEASVAIESVITKREDGSYGFVSIDVAVDATIVPEPEGLRELLEKAEWGCFIGASLRPKPAYTWRVNGRELG